MTDIEEWDETHPRWQEFVACLETVAPDQAAFVLGERYRGYPYVLLVALQSSRLVGFLKFAVQPIGPEALYPVLYLDGVPLTEAKIHAFAVRAGAAFHALIKPCLPEQIPPVSNN